MTLFLKSITIKNFRSCLNTKISFEKDLTTLNGILLLRETTGSQNLLLAEQIKGQTANFACSGELLVAEKNLKFKFEFKVIIDEKGERRTVVSRQKWDFSEINGKKGWTEVPGFISTAKNKLPVQCNKILKKVAEFFSSISYYSPSQFADTAKCPNFIELENDRELKNSSAQRDHLYFLLGLYRGWKEKSPDFERFMFLAGPQCLKLIESLSFQEVEIPASQHRVLSAGKYQQIEHERKVIVPEFFVDKIKLSPDQLSEGSFKTLALIFHLLTEKGKLLLIEEPEVSIHHGLLDSIIEIIKNEALDKQIVLTTHSDFVLDKVEPENVQLVRKDPEQGTLVNNLSKTMKKNEFQALKEYLKDCGTLGDYWREGGLE
jgi:ABC-type uncharacterized transport system YnjBCD ATPase subunit